MAGSPLLQAKPLALCDSFYIVFCFPPFIRVTRVLPICKFLLAYFFFSFLLVVSSFLDKPYLFGLCI